MQGGVHLEFLDRQGGARALGLDLDPARHLASLAPVAAGIASLVTGGHDPPHLATVRQIVPPDRGPGSREQRTRSPGATADSPSRRSEHRFPRAGLRSASRPTETPSSGPVNSSSSSPSANARSAGTTRRASPGRATSVQREPPTGAKSSRRMASTASGIKRRRTDATNTTSSRPEKRPRSPSPRRRHDRLIPAHARGQPGRLVQQPKRRGLVQGRRRNPARPGRAPHGSGEAAKDRESRAPRPG